MRGGKKKTNCDGYHTCEGAALKKMRRSFQANRYPRMQQCSMLRGCTIANSPTCTLPKIFSTSSSVARRILIIAAGGDLKKKTDVESCFTLILLSCLLINVLFSVIDCLKVHKVLFDLNIHILLQNNYYYHNCKTFLFFILVTHQCTN